MNVPRPFVRAVGLASVLVMLAGLLVVVAADDDGLPAAGARVTVDGRATVVHVDGSTDVLSTGDVVRAGEEVRADAGTFALDLADGGTLEGRAGFDDASDTRVVVGERPELIAGELLLLDAEGLDVDAAGTVVALAGEDAAARVDRGFAVRAASYRGGLEVDSAGQNRAVSALRQIGIASLGRPPGSAEPLRVDEVDPWDRRFLGAAIDLGRRLAAVSASFTRNAPPDASQSAALYETVLPVLAGEPSFDSKLASLPTAPAGEVFVGAVLTTLGDDGSFGDRWDEVFAFRSDGAAWGLVALDQGLEDGAVLDAVDDALGRSTTTPEVAVGPPPSVAPTVPGGGVDGDDPASSDTTLPPDDDQDPTAPPPLTPTTPPPPTVPPPTLPPLPLPPPLGPSPTPDPPEESGGIPDTGVPLLDNLVQPIEDLLGGLLDP